MSSPLNIVVCAKSVGMWEYYCLACARGNWDKGEYDNLCANITNEYLYGNPKKQEDHMDTDFRFGCMSLLTLQRYEAVCDDIYWFGLREDITGEELE